MMQPGFKVMHVQDLDFRSVCQPFKACLEEVRAWSHGHPGHIPIFILVETKQESTQGPMHLTEAELFTAKTFDELDAEIRSVFSPEEMITPDDVRGSYKTLNEAVLAGRWPTLRSARGKVIFLMDQRPVGPQRFLRLAKIRQTFLKFGSKDFSTLVKTRNSGSLQRRGSPVTASAGGGLE